MDVLLATESTGAGSTFYLNGLIAQQHAVQVEIVVASSAVTIDLEGSLDGEVWFQLMQHVLSGAEIAALKALFFNVNPQPVTYVRANLITNTGDGIVTTKYIGV